MIIGITGKIGSGKTTLAQYLVEQHDYKEYSFANPLKEIAIILGFSHEQVYGTQENKLEIHPYWNISAREFLQKAGTELFRQQLPCLIPSMQNIWINLFKMNYNNNQELYVISDVRFLDEVKAIVDLGGIIIRTKRTNPVISTRGNEIRHVSELEMDLIRPDYVIDNDQLSKDESKKAIDHILKVEYEKRGKLKV